MLWLAIIAATGGVAGKLADIEDRNGIVFGILTAAAAFALSRALGTWFWLAPFLALAGVFAVLGYLRARDDRNRPGGRIVR